MTWAYDLDHRHEVPLDEVRALVGGKAANLGVMIRELGLPVPPGFAITTEACRAFLAGGWPEGLDEEIRERLARVEEEVGRRFGDASDPLLVSVRSGAPVSMPGMMDTILNLGLTSATTDGLAAASGDPMFAGGCRKHLVTMFRDTVGVDEVPDDPWAQLRLAIEAVFRSWNGERARTYRQKEGLPDDLGTGVVVQAMVFGNRGERSATGVLFTRNPATGEARPYGDVMFNAQGEDVVAGTHQTEPISVLDERLPEVAAELRTYAERLERHYADLCDIEFTIEEGRLWMLQVRVGKRSPQAALRMAREMAEDASFPLSREEAVRRVARYLANPPVVNRKRTDGAEPLLIGLAASPGTASGEIATSPHAAERAAGAGRTVILVRPHTSPDDVHGMAKAAGILTATGGLTSHAAVVARGWGIPAVVGAAALDITDGEVGVGGRTLREGDVITIDGDSGEVFEGAVSATSETVPEAETLSVWARELGIAIESQRDTTDTRAASVTTRGATPDDVVRVLGIKGLSPAQGIADALASNIDVVQPVLDRLVEDGLATTTAGAYRLTDDGKTRSGDLVAAERDAWGVDRAAAALDDFLALDHRVKATVTAWQVRDADGEAVVNDHSDADYDRSVLDRLAAVHTDASAWLASNEGGYPRLAAYRERLDAAVANARAGDGRYVASPRVDSYHGVWFELHEDLILLAGRTREDEVAAGRA